jgi:hypothetical protein
VALDAAHPGLQKLGIELSETGVAIARRRLPRAIFLRRDLLSAQDTAIEYPGFATHAVCSEVLEHVDDPVLLLKNARGYMAEGCRLIVTVPGGPKSAFDIYIGHRRHYSPADLSDVLRAAGFSVSFAMGAGFPFFNLYRLLVIARGNKLITDTERQPSYLLRSVSAVFRMLFRLNIASSRLGWQTVAVARKE